MNSLMSTLQRRFYYNFPELGRFTIIMRRKSRVLRRLEEDS